MAGKDKVSQCIYCDEPDSAELVKLPEVLEKKLVLQQDGLTKVEVVEPREIGDAFFQCSNCGARFTEWYAEEMEMDIKEV